MRVWRLAWNRPNALAAFTPGNGAGRFNPPGVGVIYTSTTLPLAVLEVMAHWEEYFNFEGYVTCTADLPDDLNVEHLPEGFPVTDRERCREYGLSWHEESRAAALVVPSVLMPEVCGERNVILNPAHPDFDRLLPSLRLHGPFSLDHRILGALRTPN
ncbi:RES family NAD+ phosphorylase [Deinococcus pimensis]|uniref:RES family NAD+ phosphorylase n=1 Tax=Deinococcus pimensis TaxID=309888 RepID=UPI000484CCCD|nr:RES family NAD+ phosphorylase [Deinococcus pimensis]